MIELVTGSPPDAKEMLGMSWQATTVLASSVVICKQPLLIVRATSLPACFMCGTSSRIRWIRRSTLENGNISNKYDRFIAPTPILNSMCSLIFSLSLFLFLSLSQPKKVKSNSCSQLKSSTVQISWKLCLENDDHYNWILLTWLSATVRSIENSHISERPATNF